MAVLIDVALPDKRSTLEEHKVDVDVAPDLPEVRVNADLIVLALRQLIDNAVKPSAMVIRRAKRVAD